MSYEITAGTVRGTMHRENNQDAHAFSSNGTITVSVVADGCSAGKYSQVGSNLACHMLQAELLNLMKNCYPRKTFHYCLERSVRRVCSHMDLMTAWGSRSHIIEQFFLFTLVGCVTTEDEVFFFNLGDGCIIVNGEQLECDTGNALPNMPPYLAYRITDAVSVYDLDFKIQAFAAVDVESALIGSDGVHDLIPLEERHFPGTDELIGPISQFWTTDLYFRNSDCVRRTLFRINRERYLPRLRLSGEPALKRHPGLLRDDTTLIALRKLPNGQE